MLVVFIASVLGIGLRIIGIEENEKTASLAREIYIESQIENKNNLLEEENKNQEIQVEDEKKKELELKFKELAKMNEDIVAWINVDSTAVDYPVVLGDDNDYYLNHGLDGNWNIAGSIFMDFRNRGDGSDRNMIMYGHHMKNGSMFKGLIAFKDPEFYKNHGKITFETPNGEENWQVFSAYVTSTDFYYIETYFENDESFDYFVDSVAKKSMHGYDENSKGIERIMTLSTCSYEFKNARFVVHARLLDENSQGGL